MHHDMKRTLFLALLAPLSLTLFLLPARGAAPEERPLVRPAYGASWLRLLHPVNHKKALAAGTVQDGIALPLLRATDWAAENELWSLQGDEKGFHLCSRTLGGSYALSLTWQGRQAVGLALLPLRHATLWRMIRTEGRFGVTPIHLYTLRSKKDTLFLAHNEQGDITLAPHAGNTTMWLAADASREVSINTRVKGTTRAAGQADYVAEVTLMGEKGSSALKERTMLFTYKAAQEEQTLFLPLTEPVTLKNEWPCRGYRREEWIIDDHSAPELREVVLPANGEAKEKRHITLSLLREEDDGSYCLFHTYDDYHVPYRIPALALTRRGQLLAMSDRRYCGSDIGYGRVDIVLRTSLDRGATWSPDATVLQGGGKGRDTGFGDACLVADRDSDEALLVCVAGDVPYARSNISNPQLIVRSEGRYNPQTNQWTWSAPVDMTQQIYHDLLGGKVGGLFMSSGRILQSRRTKMDKYYRLYAALCTHKGNFVIYSDDFGRQWSVLGSSVEPCVPKGDEAKCEELPDGSILISSRKGGGRWWNVFHFTNPLTAAGAWGEAVDSRLMDGGINNLSGPCNGEVLLVTAVDNTTRKETPLLLHSLPAGPQRHNGTIYYKALTSKDTYDTPQRLAQKWDGAYLASPRAAAYSTMQSLPDGRIALYIEEGPECYQMIYLPLSIETITNGRYSAPKAAEEDNEQENS